MLRDGKVAIVCHDAGGAEILSSLISRHKTSFVASLSGPAKEIFRRKLGYSEQHSIKDAINRSDWVLTGTGWESSFEYDAIDYAIKNKRYVISFLDHWVNFRERFNWHGPEVLPNEIWVGDEDALNIANEVFPDMLVNLFLNPFWLDCKEMRNRKKIPVSKKSKKVLYVSSNIDKAKEKQKDINFSDADIFNKFLFSLSKLEVFKEVEHITIKLHPSEDRSKFKDYSLNSDNIFVSLTEEKDNLDLITGHDIVIGFESMMLVLSDLLGKYSINIDMGAKRLKKIPDKYFKCSI